MRRWILGSLVVLLALLGGALLAERAVLARLDGAGVRWERLERGALDRAFFGVQRGPVRVEEIRWTLRDPRRLVMRGVDVDLAQLGEGGGEGGGGGGKLPEGLSLELSDLRVRYGERTLLEGLSGELLDGVGALDGDGAQLSLPGPEGARAALSLSRTIDSAQVQGELRLDALWTDPPRLTLRSDSLTLRDPLLSPEPLVLREISAELVAAVPERKASGTLRIGAVQAEISLSCAPECAAELLLPETELSTLLAPMAPLLPELRGAEVRGSAHGRAVFRWVDGALSAELEPVIDGLRVRGAVPRIEALRGGVFDYPVTASDGSRRLRPLGEGAAGWTPLREVSPMLIAAVIASEDAGFRHHPGYDASAIAEALAQNRDAGRVVRGGSTLTQQLAKNLFLDGSRTIQRKIRELLLAAELDSSLGKERVLTLYLNAVEWGPDFWGVSAACDRYFLRKPATVLPNEAAFLAALLPNPRGYYQWWYLEKRPNRQVIADILNRMAQQGALSKAEAQRWAEEPLRFVPPPR